MRPATTLQRNGEGSSFFSVFLGFLFGVWVVTLWILSSLPSQDIHLPPFPEADKVAHFGYFFIGAFLLAWLLRRELGWRGWKLLCGALCAIALIGGWMSFTCSIPRLFSSLRGYASEIDVAKVQSELSRYSLPSASARLGQRCSRRKVARVQHNTHELSVGTIWNARARERN